MTDLANTDKRTVGNVDIFTLSIDEVGYSAQTDTKHSRKKGKVWKLLNTFENADAAKASVQPDEWSVNYSGKNLEGIYKVFRCNKSKQVISQKRKATLLERQNAKKVKNNEEVLHWSIEDDYQEINVIANKCSCERKLLFKADSQQVLLYETVAEHNFHNSKKQRINPGVIESIEKLFDLGVTKPSSIIMQLRNENCQSMPTRQQIYSHLVKIKLKKFGHVNISLNQLEEWLENHSDLPDDCNAGFVVKYETGLSEVSFLPISDFKDIDETNVGTNDDKDDNNDMSFFRFLLTTKTLMKYACNNDFICIDATYKLIWLGFPVMLVGSVDKKRQFHPFGISVCSNEKAADFTFIFKSVALAVQRLFDEVYQPKILQSDSANAIVNGFMCAFDYNDVSDFVRLNCWAHVRRNLEKKINCVKDSEIKAELWKNICLLQNAHDKSSFDLLCNLFMKKWKNKYQQDIDQFVDYMKANWIEINSNWFEGAACGYPSTNNALEATNNDIKNSHTFRERLPLAEFSVLCIKIVEKWSKDRDASISKDVLIYKEAPLDNEDWCLAVEFASSGIPIHRINTDYYFTYDPDTKITLSKINSYKKCIEEKRCNKFENYEALVSTVGKVHLNSENWRKSTCICSKFQKLYNCKHIIGIALREKIITVPKHLIPTILQKKRGPGAPKKAKGGKCLIVE